MQVTPMQNTPSFSNYDKQVDMVRSLFLEYDQEALIRKFSLESDAAWIYLTYMNAPFRISRETGRVDSLESGQWRECRAYNAVMTIYDLLCHHKGDRMPALSGSWCAIGSFVVTGVQDTGTFTKKFAACFQDRTEALKAACLRLGGTLQKPLAGADVTCRIPITGFFPVMLQFWDGDDEFPPKLTLLWDKNALSFLHFETTFFLQGDLLERIKALMDEEA